MKFRIGFVSNSSSSSFMVPKSALSSDQIRKIRNYKRTVKEMLKIKGLSEEDRETLNSCDGGWSITETEHSIRGFTIMDNFSMGSFLRIIGVPEEEISTEGEY